MADIDSHPSQELARLARAGVVRRLAHGYYVVVPDDEDDEWSPTLEAAAAGIGAAIYGPRESVLMGVSAARVHGAIPRALAVAVVGVPAQHREIALPGLGGARLRFVKRDLVALDVTMERLDVLGAGLVTSVEQTLLDLARHQPREIDATQLSEAVRSLWSRADPQVVDALASQQRGRAPLDRLRKAFDERSP